MTVEAIDGFFEEGVTELPHVPGEPVVQVPNPTSSGLGSIILNKWNKRQSKLINDFSIAAGVYLL